MLAVHLRTFSYFYVQYTCEWCSRFSDPLFLMTLPLPVQFFSSICGINHSWGWSYSTLTGSPPWSKNRESIYWFHFVHEQQAFVASINGSLLLLELLSILAFCFSAAKSVIGLFSSIYETSPPPPFDDVNWNEPHNLEHGYSGSNIWALDLKFNCLWRGWPTNEYVRGCRVYRSSENCLMFYLKYTCEWHSGTLW